MFKIHDDKVYFVAETPDINKVIEIFLPKDDRGTIMDSYEIRVDLCRAVIHVNNPAQTGSPVMDGACGATRKPG